MNMHKTITKTLACLTFGAGAIMVGLTSASAEANLPAGFPVTDGLSVYLDAESIDASGTHVRGMFDRSGQGNHAWEVGVDAPSMPTLLQSATPSGQDAVRFDGIGGYAEVPSNPADFDGRAKTIFLVFRADALGAGGSSGSGRLLNNSYAIIDSWEPANLQNSIRHRTNEIWLQSQGYMRVNARNPLGGFVGTQTDPDSVTAGEFYIGVHEWKWNGDIFAHIRNAANETSSNDAIGAMAEPEGHLHTRIAAGSNTRTPRVEEFFGGEIAAVLIYNRELSFNEREDVELYLHGAYLDSTGGTAPGTPPVTDGLVLHLNGANVVTDGENVTQWTDVSGRDNHAATFVHDPQPDFPMLVSAATPTGQDAVRFDGVGSLADVGPNPEDFDGRAKTTITVFRPTYLAGTDYVTTTAYESLNPDLPLAEQSDFRTRTNWIRAFGDIGGNLRVSNRTLTGGAVNISTANGSVAAGEFHIGVNQLRENGDLASIVRGPDNQRFENVGSGADAVPGGHLVTRLGGSFAPGDISIAPAGEFFEGEIAAFLIYNRELSNAELLQVEEHLYETYFTTGPGGGGPQNPPVTDGLVLHLNGANVITSDGTRVTQLTDISGRGNNAAGFIYEAPRAGGPSLVAGGAPTGLPSVRFNGIEQYLEIASNPEDFDGWPKTTMVVFNAAELTGRLTNIAYEEVSPELAPSGRTRFGELHPWSSGGGRLRANNRTDSGGFIGANTPDGSLSTGAYFLGINLARENGDTVAILRNAANERFEGVAESTPPDPRGHIHTRIGAGSGFGNTTLDMFYSGEIAAVVIFNRELSAEELEEMESFLYSRYINSDIIGTTFAEWIVGFDLPPALAGPDDDASGDGVPNLIKFAIGANPGEASLERMPQSFFETVNGDTFLVMTVDKNPDAVGIDYIIEASHDLVNWDDAAEGLVITDSGDQIEARIPASLNGEPRAFLRLRVVLD